MVPPRTAHRTASEIGYRSTALVARSLVGLLLGWLFVFLPVAEAQNINELLRILLPPSQPQPHSTVRNPGEYAPPRPAPQFPMEGSTYAPPVPQVARAEVLQLQRMLNDLGYEAGVADGVAGRKTMDALNAFRRANGLPASSTVDSGSVAAVSTAHGDSGSSPPGYAAPASVSTAAQPSFDCARAVSPTELALCSDVALGALDVQLAALYAQELSRRGPQAASFKNEQRQWLSQRNGCLGDRSCLLTAYALRIAAIASPVAAPPQQGTLVANDTAPLGSPAIAASIPATAPARPGPVKASGSDLRALANSPPGLQPVTFRYFQGMPILQQRPSAHLFSLMSFAHQLPTKEQECFILRTSLLTQDVVKQFMGEDQHQCWRGRDEFQAADTRRDFYARYLEAIKSFAPKPPFRMVFIQKNRLGAYQADPGQFRLTENLNQGLGAGFSLGSSRHLGISVGQSWPEAVLPADEAAARNLLERARSWAEKNPNTKKEFRTDRDVNVVGVIDVLSVDYAARRLDIGLVSLSLYDPDLQEKIYDFPVAPSFDALIRGKIPERLKMPSPAPLDRLYAVVQSVGLDKDVSEGVDHRWRVLYTYLRERDKAFYAALPQEQLSDDDVRLPVFAFSAGNFTDNDKDKLERWAAAYRAGLPDQLELVDGMDGRLHRDIEGKQYVFAPLHKESGSLQGYADILDAEGLQEEQVVRWSGSGDVRTLLVAPNRIDLYRLAVEQDKLPSQARWRQRALFRAGPVKQVNDAEGKPILLVYLEPISLTIESDEGTIAQRTYQDIPHLDGSFVATQQQPEPSATADGPLPLSPALLDLIIAKALGQQLSEPALSHITARRWKFENDKEPAIGGNFYVQGKRQPKSEELAEITPKFRVWAASAVSAPPFTLKVGVRIPNSYPSSRETVAWSVLSCSDSGARPVDRRTSIKREGAALAAYTALLQHDNASHNKIAGDRQKWELMRQYEQSKYKASGVSDWNPESDERLVNLHAAYGILDRYQRVGDICGLSAEDLGYPNPARVYLLLQDALPAVKQEQNAPPLNAEITLEITGVRLADTEPHFSDLLPPKFVQAYGLAPPKRIPMEAIILDSRLKEVVYSDGSGQEVARLSPDEAQSIQGHLDSVSAYEAAQSNIAPPSELDVVGIKLGMTLEEAEKIIRDHMDVGRVLEGKRLYDGSLKSGQLIPATSGKLFISKDERELIAILDEPPAAEGKVLAAWRRVYIPGATVSANDATAALYDKYGEPTMADKRANGMAYGWRGSGQNGCMYAHTSGAKETLAVNWRENGERADVKIEGGVPTPDARLPAPYRDPFNPEYKNPKECGPEMSAEINFEATQWMSSGVATRKMDWIEQRLTDVAVYLQAFNASREASKATGPANGEGTPPQDRADGLKF